MSPRRMILRELRKRHLDGAARYTRPSSIPGFGDQASRYQQAVNRLLQERLINGTKDDDGRLAIALNEHRLADVAKELRPWFARSAAWMAVVVAAAVLAVSMVLRG